MRFYVKFDENGKLKSYMMYPYLNATMEEVTVDEYVQILITLGVIKTRTNEELDELERD